MHNELGNTFVKHAHICHTYLLTFRTVWPLVHVHAWARPQALSIVLYGEVANMPKFHNMKEFVIAVTNVEGTLTHYHAKLISDCLS